jgi:hypothetical protein
MPVKRKSATHHSETENKWVVTTLPEREPGHLTRAPVIREIQITTGVTVLRRNLFVADMGNHRIRKILNGLVSHLRKRYRGL